MVEGWEGWGAMAVEALAAEGMAAVGRGAWVVVAKVAAGRGAWVVGAKAAVVMGAVVVMGAAAELQHKHGGYRHTCCFPHLRHPVCSCMTQPSV